jgi:hypothetical protein
MPSWADRGDDRPATPLRQSPKLPADLSGFRIERDLLDSR